MKFLLIIGLLGFLAFLFLRRIFFWGKWNFQFQVSSSYIEVKADPRDVQATIRLTLTTALTGAILMAIIVLLGWKLKILFILVPIALYLCGQAILLLNHVRYVKNNRIWYNPTKAEFRIVNTKGDEKAFLLYQDIRHISVRTALQPNKGIVFGYYELQSDRDSLKLPFLYTQNRFNSFIFEELNRFDGIERKSSFFPLV